MLKAVLERLALWALAFYYATLVLFDILKQSFQIGFSQVLSWKPRTKPACLDDPELGTHGYLHLQDVRIHYVVSGPEDKPLMLFLHGFPEFWFSWRHQIKEFQKDYRVVAIDMRGYGESDKPRGIDAYRREKLTSDVKQVIQALGYKSCILVAHDWGSVGAWSLVKQFPDMVDKLIVINSPPLHVFQKIAAKEPVQRKYSWYMFFFQLPWLPELYFKINNYGAFDHVFDKQEARFSFSETFQNPMSTEDVQAYKYVFSQPGALTPPINYYRALLPMKNETSDVSYSKPVLVVWGLKDIVAHIANLEFMEKVYPSFTFRRIQEGGHFVQMEAPETVNRAIREWLE